MPYYPPPPSIETTLTEIADRGWLLNNFFQLDSGLWQANLRSATHHTNFAQAESPSEALALCIDLIETAIEPEIKSVEVFTGDLPKLDLLAKFRQPVDRRI